MAGAADEEERGLAEERGDPIRTEIAAHTFTVDTHTILVTVSVGVAQVNEDTRAADDLIRSADQKLHAARLDRR